MTAITLHDILKFQSVASRWALLLESNVGPLDVRARQFLGLQPLHFLLTGSHLTGPSTRRKTRDELIQLGDLLLPLRIFSFYSRPDLRFLQYHVVVSARIRDDRLVVDIRDVRANAVQEIRSCEITMRTPS